MAHEEQNDPVAQSSTSKSPTTSTADLSERDNKENPVVKEEETNDTEVFEEVVVEVARLPKEPKSSVSPPPGYLILFLWFNTLKGGECARCVPSSQSVLSKRNIIQHQ